MDVGADDGVSNMDARTGDACGVAKELPSAPKLRTTALLPLAVIGVLVCIVLRVSFLLVPLCCELWLENSWLSLMADTHLPFCTETLGLLWFSEPPPGAESPLDIPDPFSVLLVVSHKSMTPFTGLGDVILSSTIITDALAMVTSQFLLLTSFVLLDALVTSGVLSLTSTIITSGFVVECSLKTNVKTGNYVMLRKVYLNWY